MNRFIKVLLLGLAGLVACIFLAIAIPFIFIHAPYLILVFIVVFGIIGLGALLEATFFGGPNY